MPPRLTTSVRHEPPPGSPPGPGGSIAFPATLNLYHDATAHLLLLFRHRPPHGAYLGARRAQPSHHISPDRRGWVDLHAGPDKDTPVVARYVHRSSRGRHRHHLLHGRKSGDRNEPAAAAAALGPVPPHVTFPLGHGRPVRLDGAFPYRFEMDVPAPAAAPAPAPPPAPAPAPAAVGGSVPPASTPPPSPLPTPPPTPPPPPPSPTRSEAFEWRHSQGAAVRRTGRRSGYKLVRLATDGGAGGGGERATGGGEVVAVFAVSSSSRASPSSWWGRRRGRGGDRGGEAGVFMFQGTGAQGVLGARWQLVAVMTAVGFWDAGRRAGRAAGLGEWRG